MLSLIHIIFQSSIFYRNQIKTNLFLSLSTASILSLLLSSLSNFEKFTGLFVEKEEHSAFVPTMIELVHLPAIDTCIVAYRASSMDSALHRHCYCSQSLCIENQITEGTMNRSLRDYLNQDSLSTGKIGFLNFLYNLVIVEREREGELKLPILLLIFVVFSDFQ